MPVRANAMIFRQLFEPASSTCTHLLGCESTGQALLIDPVLEALPANRRSGASGP